MDEFDILDYIDTGSGIFPMEIENIVGGGGSTANIGTPINRPYGSSSGGSEVAGGGFAFPLALGLGTGNDESASGYLHLFDPSNTTFVKHYIGRTQEYYQDNRAVDTYYAGYCNVTAAIDGVQFSMSAGNIDAGTIKLYGVT